jgi:hypothetical protein
VHNGRKYLKKTVPFKNLWPIFSGTGFKNLRTRIISIQKKIKALRERVCGKQKKLFSFDFDVYSN